MSSEEITLNSFECGVAAAMAKDHHERILAGASAPMSKIEALLEGHGAELAYGKWANLYPPLELGPDRYDFMLPDGRTVDVKVTSYPKGRLAVEQKLVFSCVDLYALMVGVFPVYRFAGYFPADQLFKLERLKILNPEHPPAYCADQSELNPFPVF